MPKFLVVIIIVLVFQSGCTGTQKQSDPLAQVKTAPVDKVVEEKPKEELIDAIAPPAEENISPALRNINAERMEELADVKQGVVFAKADFLGVLQKPYVKLIIENSDNPSQKYQIYIGDKSKQVPFARDIQVVQPGYFFVELPEGSYRISSITIPVGSSFATEIADIRFNVPSDAISYLGTLRVTGTKERIKLGGVPVIQPGFEYLVEVIDEREEGVSEFKKRYPNVNENVQVEIMNVHKISIVGS